MVGRRIDVERAVTLAAVNVVNDAGAPRRRWAQRFWIWAGLWLIASTLTGCERRTEFPARPILLVCPWAAGGGTDRVSRVIAAHLQTQLGVNVNVVNATGGKGATGHNRGMTARPDGYTLTMTTLELNMMHWNGLTNLTVRDCIPLMSVNEDYAAIFVRADAPWSSLAELETAIHDHPGELRASGTTSGGTWHLAVAGWLQSQRLPIESIKWISFTGSLPSLQELLSGGIQLVCCSLPEADTFLESGQIRCLGVMCEHRAPGYPEVPTFRELGRDWSLGGWRAISVPLGTPADVQQKLVAALEAVVNGRSRVDGLTFGEFMDQAKFDHTHRQGADLLKFLADNDAVFGRMLANPEFKSINEDPYPPMGFPYLLLALMLLSLVVGFVTRANDGLLPHEVAARLPQSFAAYSSALTVVIGIAAYSLLAETVGFVLTSAGVLLLLTYKMGASWKWILGVAGVFPLVVYQLFAQLLEVPLPQGWLGW